MNNFKITLEFTRDTDSNLSTAAGVILGDVQQHGNYYDFIMPESQNLQSQLIAFNALLQQCSSGDKVTIEKKNLARVPLVETLKTMAVKIDLQNQVTPLGNNEYILKSGFPHNNGERNVRIVESIESFNLSQGLHKGEIVATVKGAKNAISFLYFYSTDPTLDPEKWSVLASSKQKITITGLKEGEIVNVYVKAIGTNDSYAVSETKHLGCQ